MDKLTIEQHLLNAHVKKHMDEAINKTILKCKDYMCIAIDGRMFIEENNMELDKQAENWQDVYNSDIRLEVYNSMKPLIKSVLNALIFNLKHGSEKI